MKTIVLAAVFALIVAGCDSWEQPKPTTKQAPSSSKEAEPPTAGETSLETLLAGYESAKSEYESNTTAAAAKQKYIDAAILYADALTYRQGGVPREKYPKALAIYNAVLGIEKSNKRAEAGKQIILDIYQSMGKEPPKAGS